jgi:PAS domain S-box-containing protein
MKAGLPFTFSWKWLAQLAGFAGLYFALARFGNIAMVAEGNVSTVWPAAGLAVAGLWWGGYRLAPAIALGAFVFAWLNGVPAPVGVSAAFASMLGPIVAVFLMRRYIDAPRLFDRVGDVFLFFLCAGAAPALVDALGVASLCWGVGKWEDFLRLWLLSWAGDLVGTLIAAPTLLVWTWPDRLPWTARMRVEAAGGFALLAICSALIFTGKLGAIGVGFPFLVLPVVVWIALRLGQRATVSATLLACAFPVWGTLHGMGPFAELDMPLPVLALFMGVMAMTGLVLVASVTERRQTQSALRQSEERSRLLVENAKGYAIYMLDAEGRIATWSAEAERIKGYRAEEIVGKPFRTFFTREDAHRGVPEQVLRMAREEGQARYEGWRVRKDGSRFCVEGVITAVRDESGALNGYSKVAHDVTDRKRAEEALRESEEGFRTLVEGLPQLIWTCLPDGRCDYLSPQWVRYTGIPEEQQLGFGWLEQIDPADRERAAAAWKGAVETHTTLDVEFRIRGADGMHRWFKVRGVPLRDAEGRVVKWFGTNTDIDDQKRANELLEAKVRERTAQLQASLSSVEELLYTIAHDLRAPNRHMQSFAQLLLLEHADRLDDTARDYLSRISETAARSDELIRDLLEYGRLSHEAVALAPVDARRTVEAVLQAVAGEIQRRHAHVQFGQEWPRVVANERLLERILTNFVSNALLYVPPDREPEIAISAESEGGKAVLRVQDNGIGIPPDQIGRVFEPFIRLPNTTNAPGTGMGLAIVRKAAERLNGAVGADSTPGKGSCFWLELQAA